MHHWNDWNKEVIEEFRAAGGIGAGQFEGRPLFLLHHVGARTGTKRIAPLLYQDVEGGYAIFASKGGSPTNPDWYYNLLANPEVGVELGGEVIPARARVTEGAERERIWSRQKREYPFFAEYDEKTTREIPVIVLDTL